ncbi:MAG: aminoglycoside phosphotransferase family protein [Gemmatimonadales bacterium]
MNVLATGDVRDALKASQLPAAAELGAAVQELCGGADAAAPIVGLRQLKRGVYRVQIEAGDGVRSLVIKSSDPALGRHNQLVARRWLPAVGLSGACARVLGCAADPRGEGMWLIYEDLGESTLDAAKSDRRRVAAAVELIATLHVRSAGHAVLPECRHHGRDLGAAYIAANVNDAIQGLEMLGRSRVVLSPAHRTIRDGLLARLCALRGELPDRLRMLAVHGGPAVLLHGDLWPTNAFVVDGPDGLVARLVDWDGAGVGPASYDLSTFLLRFPLEERPWILERYRAAVVESAGWRLPSTRDLNVLFETAECARYANHAVWPAVALLVDGAEWAFDALAIVAGWFADLRPVLPE